MSKFNLRRHMKSQITRRGVQAAVLSFSLATGSFAMIACSPAKWHEVQGQRHVEQPAPFTGDPVSEQQTVNNQPGDIKQGDTVTVRPGQLCGHRIPSGKVCEKNDPILERGDTVTVKDPEPGDDGQIEVEIPPKKHGDAPIIVHVPPQYVTPKPVPPSLDELNADRYIVIENIATEKLRVYERCTEAGCHKHRLVLETDMVVGANSPDRRSLLGSYRITEWFKFYQDNQDEYPSWYSAAFPQLPAPGQDLIAWVSESLLPQGQGSVRGAFGWYTAYIGPNASEQWTHGTWGWGADSDRFIQAVRNGQAGNDPRLASHGCSRVENRAIAMMREILVPGTRVIKIYAREAYAQQPKHIQEPRYGTWDWILTTEGVDQANAPRSGRASVLARQVPQSEMLESGRYRFDVTPTAILLSEDGSGNVYGISAESMQGRFLVDEGLLDGYRHPSELGVGGYSQEFIPSVIQK